MHYPGGKFRCYQRLINMIPPHRVYIETHLGGGAVLRHKAPAEFSIGIDRDAKVVRSFSNQFDSSFQFLVSTAEAFLDSYAFDGGEFVYVDPPYWPASRRSLRCAYRFDYTEADHLNLLQVLRRVPARVMISGYRNLAYDRALEGWVRRTFPGTSHAGSREETVWMNYNLKTLHDIRYLGSTFRERQSVKRKRARWAARFRSEPLIVQQAVLADLSTIFGQSQKEPALSR